MIKAGVKGLDYNDVNSIELLLDRVSGGVLFQMYRILVY
jgi:hypothetical protein